MFRGMATRVTGRMDVWRGEAGCAPGPGEVWLVGAGPGDARQLTIAAAEAIAGADVVLHDALPERGALMFLRPDARAVAVGKRKGQAAWTQAAIVARMVAEARAGRRVVRLKGGDPAMFARTAEEIEGLAAAGIGWRILPGVTAASAAAAVAGVPLTRRGAARSVSFVTGHDAAGELPDWPGLAADGTLVAYMALSRLDEIALRLLSAGHAAGTPVLVVGRAGLPGEVVLRSCLGRCTLDASRARVAGPALVVIGAAAGFVPAGAAAEPERAGRIRRARA